jgi:hypothetical protein
MKYINKIFLSISAAVIVAFAPMAASAAVVFSTSANQTVGSSDTFIVNVQINTEGENINVVQGDIQIAGESAKVTDISTGGSVLQMWPKTPAIDNSTGSQMISFIGGVPGGFNGPSGSLFNIIFQASKPGDLVVTPQNIKAYKNDGKGTSLVPTIKPLVVTVSAAEPVQNNTWKDLLASDKTPPLDFAITIGENPSVFEGKKFINFNTTDTGSGMDYYTVSEGDSAPQRATSPYVLQDQSVKSVIKVYAYDKAGNVRIATLAPLAKTSNKKAIVLWIVIISAIIILTIVLIRFRKNKKVNP